MVPSVDAPTDASAKFAIGTVPEAAFIEDATTECETLFAVLDAKANEEDMWGALYAC
jgi:hypothetical protein